MRIFYTVIFALTFSSSVFAEAKSVNVYDMYITEQALETHEILPKTMKFRILCIDGYRYLFTGSGVTQMKENYKGKYRHMECPIKP
tara:strand:+ start:177 stop:434 length:258 start_codon:yes stop_codon:yes gene_type:complete